MGKKRTEGQARDGNEPEESEDRREKKMSRTARLDSLTLEQLEHREEQLKKDLKVANANLTQIKREHQVCYGVNEIRATGTKKLKVQYNLQEVQLEIERRRKAQAPQSPERETPARGRAAEQRAAEGLAQQHSASLEAVAQTPVEASDGGSASSSSFRVPAPAEQLSFPTAGSVTAQLGLSGAAHGTAGVGVAPSQLQFAGCGTNSALWGCGGLFGGGGSPADGVARAFLGGGASFVVPAQGPLQPSLELAGALGLSSMGVASAVAQDGAALPMGSRVGTLSCSGVATQVQADSIGVPAAFRRAAQQQAGAPLSGLGAPLTGPGAPLGGMGAPLGGLGALTMGMGAPLGAPEAALFRGGLGAPPGVAEAALRAWQM